MTSLRRLENWKVTGDEDDDPVASPPDCDVRLAERLRGRESGDDLLLRPLVVVVVGGVVAAVSPPSTCIGTAPFPASDDDDDNVRLITGGEELALPCLSSSPLPALPILGWSQYRPSSLCAYCSARTKSPCLTNSMSAKQCSSNPTPDLDSRRLG